MLPGCGITQDLCVEEPGCGICTEELDVEDKLSSLPRN